MTFAPYPVALGDSPNQCRVQLQMLQTDSITGTSTSTPTTVAKAAPEPGPNSVIATAWHLFLYVNPALDQGAVAKYIAWIRSDDEQEVVKDVGYFPLGSPEAK